MARPMEGLRLKSYRFRAEREADWRKLETLLARAEGRGPAALSEDQLLAAPVLYRAALSSLSVARATSLDQGVIDYLESLCARAYFFVYGTRSTLSQRIGRFFAHDWPAAVRGLWRETLVSLGLTIVGTVATFVLVMRDPDWFNAFVPGWLAGDRGPGASTAALRATLFDAEKGQPLSAFAAALFTHNAGIAIFAFALGFALCVPTAALITANGCMLGAFLALFVSHGLGVEAGGWLSIHGVTEIFAIVLAGAAGFRIGTATAYPGDLTRLEAAAAAGRRAGVVMIGAILMLFCAGGLEGIGRQVIQSTPIRYAIAATTLLIWVSYFYLTRLRESDDGRR
jgi:uncharacterized membrane protein SpoIIM required for sporulation